MVDIPFIAQVASLIGDPARCNMLCALKDDGELSASELAQVAGVAPNTTSAHLAKLTQGALVTFEQQGRNRFYRVASPEVAEALEALESLAAQGSSNLQALRGPREAVHQARSCYDHLAGRMGVKLADAFLDKGLLAPSPTGWRVTPQGCGKFTKLGIDVESMRRKRRCLVRQCPDWSEGKRHLGGALGAALFKRFVELKWLRQRRSSRVIDVTALGNKSFKQYFGLVN